MEQQNERHSHKQSKIHHSKHVRLHGVAPQCHIVDHSVTTINLVGIRKPRFSKQRKWLMKGEIEDSHRHKATNMQTSQESTILMAIYGSLWDISTLTNESTLSQGLCSQNEKEKHLHKHCLQFFPR